MMYIGIFLESGKNIRLQRQMVNTPY